MDFAKTQNFKSPPIAADEKALRAIEAVLAKSGECTYAHYQDRYSSLNALLTGRSLPLDRLELDAPAATVIIEPNGVTVYHLPEAVDMVGELSEVLQRAKIISLARGALIYKITLIALLCLAMFRDDLAFFALVAVVGALLDHVLEEHPIPRTIVKLPFGMNVGPRTMKFSGIAAILVIIVAMIVIEVFRE